MDSGSLEGHHIDQKIHNLEDIKELDDDDDEEMLCLEDIDMYIEPEPKQRNEDYEKGLYFITTTLFFFLYLVIFLL